ncbi:glycerol kinase GlpK [Gilvimarinus sp. F26214L]|uniref:glycerol kinase GlpK n=1 Tax=Gilvimarinus sp. DZF01 TaxID=3461371 RepID=UPI004045EDEA
MAYLLAIDQGTTSSRALIFDTESSQLTVAQQEFPQHFPKDGWVEHDPAEIWASVHHTVTEALEKSGLRPADIAGIGITNQRETTLVWDRSTGEPVYNAIVWQDRRTEPFCRDLVEQGYEREVQDRTGLVIDPYFSASKIRWILENVPGTRRKAKAGELAFGTVDSYLLWKLSDGRLHQTDATNASRTALFNIHRQEWDDELLRLFDIPLALMPEVRDCAADFGSSSHHWFGGEIPILAMAGDQQSALVGQACFQEGMAKSTYGTGCFLVVNTGSKVLKSEHKLLSTVAYRLDGKVSYALEGSIFVAGAAIQWLRDALRFIDTARESEGLAAQVAVDHGVFLVPAFTGLGAPHWDPHARGAILGLNRDTGIAEIVSAGLQSVCYQTRDLQETMARDGVSTSVLRVDGGMTVNNWMLQFLADILGTPVDRPQSVESTALGAAYLAGLQAGVFSSLDEIAQQWQLDREFRPAMPEAQREALYAAWLDAVARVRSRRD